MQIHTPSPRNAVRPFWSAASTAAPAHSAVSVDNVPSTVLMNVCSVGIATINHPYFDGLNDQNHSFMVKLGMVYYCSTHNSVVLRSTIGFEPVNIII